jgi:hypothetical protein
LVGTDRGRRHEAKVSSEGRGEGEIPEIMCIYLAMRDSSSEKNMVVGMAVEGGMIVR